MTRRVVELAGFMGTATLVYDDGRCEPFTGTGQTIALYEHSPNRPGCQACGHPEREHGGWDYDPERGEYWEPSECDECLCPGWQDFTPTHAYALRP